MGGRSLDVLLAKIEELESNISHFEQLNESVSSVNIGWHLEHSMLVINSVIDAVTVSTPTEFKKKTNFTKSFLFALGKFPRGKAKSPKRVKPTIEMDELSLKKHCGKTREHVPELSTLDQHSHFKHPIFGNLNLNDSIRFLELHTEHHLKIIRSIGS